MTPTCFLVILSLTCAAAGAWLTLTLVGVL